MKVLGIVASYRRFGNSELAVREVLLEAEDKGAETEMIRLTDYSIKPCTGCMRCVFKKVECPIDDDVKLIHQKMVEADALVVAVPTYILQVAGILKMLLDRSMNLMFNEPRPLVGRPAVLIVPYGVEHWQGLSLAEGSIFLLSLGYRIVDSFCVKCQGPGEILLDDRAMARCREAAERLLLGDERGKEGICPVCGNSLLEVVDLRVRCPVCNIYGHIVIEDGRLGVRFSNVENHRWTPANMKRHFEEEVFPSGARYLEVRPLIKKRLARYRKGKLEHGKEEGKDQG